MNALSFVLDLPSSFGLLPVRTLRYAPRGRRGGAGGAQEELLPSGDENIARQKLFDNGLYEKRPIAAKHSSKVRLWDLVGFASPPPPYDVTSLAHARKTHARYRD